MKIRFENSTGDGQVTIESNAVHSYWGLSDGTAIGVGGMSHPLHVGTPYEVVRVCFDKLVQPGEARHLLAMNANSGGEA